MSGGETMLLKPFSPQRKYWTLPPRSRTQTWGTLSGADSLRLTAKAAGN